MPVRNDTKSVSLPQEVLVADTMAGRLSGLLGTDAPDPRKAIHFIPCNGIHTIGMRYPVDVVFLNREGAVLRVVRNLLPNRAAGPVPSSASALEFAAGALDNVEVGDRLSVQGDSRHGWNWRAIQTLSRWPVNLFLAVLWSSFVLSLIQSLLQGGGAVSLGLLLVNTLFMVLFLTRRDSHETTNRPLDWFAAGLTVMVSLTLRPAPAAVHALIVASLALQMTGIAAMFFSLACLGRSFGIVAANRSVKCGGAYRVVRHPLYASELVFYFGFLLGNPGVYNGLAVLFILAGQMLRITAEERLLSRDSRYTAYMNEVRHRLIPGVY